MGGGFIKNVKGLTNSQRKKLNFQKGEKSQNRQRAWGGYIMDEWQGTHGKIVVEPYAECVRLLYELNRRNSP